MKKIISVFIALIVICNVNAFAFVQTEECDFFGTPYRSVQGLRNIDTNGEIFVGVIGDMIAVSTDFEKWDRVPEMRNVAAVQYLNGKFNAIGNDGYTYVSNDGIEWEKIKNNLPDVPDYNQYEHIIKNKGSVVVFLFGDNGGTYQTYDCISWKKVENIPDGLRMQIVNGKIMFISHNYMRGLYYSDTGESFTKCEIEGFDESYGGNCIRYQNGEYCIDDVWAPVENEDYYTVRYSTDLVNWHTRLAPRDNILINHGSFYEINGVLHEFNLNGYDLIYSGDTFEYGPYSMNDGVYVDSSGLVAGMPFVYYNFTDYGVFGWNGKYSYFVSKDGTYIKHDNSSFEIADSYMEDNIFYIKTADGQGWSSDNGCDWKKSDYLPSEQRIYNSASNGEYTLTSQIREADSTDNSVLTAEIKHNNGRIDKVAYEYAVGEYIKIFGGNGYFLIQGITEDNIWYYSRDGITREWEIYGLPGYDMKNNIHINDKCFMYNYRDSINYGELSQFENINAADKYVKVKLNGEFLSFATPPVIVDDRTLIPVRFLFERAGAEVIWNYENYSVTILHNGNKIELAIEDATAYVNGEAKTMDVPAKLINDKTMIPLRFISEELGFNVEWNEAEYTAEVTYTEE